LLLSIIEPRRKLHLSESDVGGPEMETVGFVGLGTIGGVVAGNIQKSGYAMVVYDIVPEAAQR
jgi:phosphoglycerate dehydrogenase-like enzyme